MLYMAYRAWLMRYKFDLWQLIIAMALSIFIFSCSSNGESDLIIRAVEWQSKALECSLKAGDIVKAGQKVTLKFTLDSSQCDYDLWVDRVRIITNDVQHPMQSIRLTGVVVE